MKHLARLLAGFLILAAIILVGGGIVFVIDLLGEWAFFIMGILGLGAVLYFLGYLVVDE